MLLTLYILGGLVYGILSVRLSSKGYPINVLGCTMFIAFVLWPLFVTIDLFRILAWIVRKD